MPKKQTKRLSGNKITAPSITGRFELTLLCGDSHSTYARIDIIEEMMKQASQIKHKARLFGGDAVNFNCIRQGASTSDTYDRIDGDIAMAKVVIDRIDPHVVLDGNHEWRSYNLLRDSNPMYKLGAERLCEKWEDICNNRINIKYNKRNGIYPIGNYNIQHGGYYGSLDRTLSTYGNTICFHYHAFRSSVNGSVNGPKHLYTVGCLCETEMPYNEKDASSLSHEQGWAWLVHDTWSDECQFVPVQRIGATWTPINFNI